MLKSRLVPQKDTEDPELPIGVEFGAKVRAARKARGWNAQRELAMRCDPPTTLLAGEAAVVALLTERELTRH